MESEKREQAREQWDSIANTFDLLMGAKTGKLDTPITAEVGFNGTEAEARGSVRHVTEQIGDEGYDVSHEHVGETTDFEGEERHEFTITVED